MNGFYTVDACALIAYFKKETGFEQMVQFLEQAVTGDISLSMHKLNVLEVYYGFYRDDGKEKAESVLADTLSLPIRIIDGLPDSLFREAGRLKAVYDISFADSLALSFASVNGKALITADHHEFDLIEQKEQISFSWIR